MTDRERLFEARRFFWGVMDKLDQVVDIEMAQRQIAKLASCLPPFTTIKPDHS